MAVFVVTTLRTSNTTTFRLGVGRVGGCKESGWLRRHSDGLQARRLGFDSRQRPDFSLLHSFHTGPEDQSASY
jgi:hypothetical protein